MSNTRPSGDLPLLLPLSITGWDLTLLIPPHLHQSQDHKERRYAGSALGNETTNQLLQNLSNSGRIFLKTGARDGGSDAILSEETAADSWEIVVSPQTIDLTVSERATDSRTSCPILSPPW